ncbi:MAG TPA: hypothetical protein VMQ56_07845, partial [Terracidiphilus sp.]|nr:hypothetical protein [Terracidiphilus sp.]
MVLTRAAIVAFGTVREGTILNPAHQGKLRKQRPIQIPVTFAVDNGTRKFICKGDFSEKDARCPWVVGFRLEHRSG